MEQNSIESNEAALASAPVVTEAAAPRRRASRRVTAAAGEAVAAPEAAGAPEVAVAAPAVDAAPVADAAPAEAEAPKKRVSRARKKADEAPAEGASEAAAPETAATDAVEEAPKKAPARRKRQTAAEKAAAAELEQAAVEAGVAAGAGDDAPAEAAPAEAAPAKTRSRSRAKANAEAAQPADASESAMPADADAAAGETAPAESAEPAPVESAAAKRRNSRSRNRKQNGDAAEAGASEASIDASEQQSDKPTEKADEQGAEKAENGQAGQNGRGGHSGNGANDNQTRSSRTRQRDRKRRGQNEDGEPELTEDDVLLPIAGILDILDNYAFVRTSGYLPGTGDVYVSLGQVKKYGLRKGDAVVGAIRQPRESDNGGRQKYNAIVKVDTVNSKPVEEPQDRPEFADFTPVNPNERLRLETDAGELGSRVTDLFAPIGKGQRGLIVGPHESGKSGALHQIARAVGQNQPDAHLMLVLLDERPEEVTELTRTINGEVIASTFERAAEDHITIAELTVERAKRLVELGHDVVVLIDSLSSLARAYNLAAPAAARVPAGQLDAAAVYPVKRLLSAARNIENGGSLTIIATVSAQPGSKFDEALLSELDGVANMQLRLSGEAADRRVFPAIDLRRSSTRNEALLTSEAEAKIMNQLRRGQAGELEALETLLDKLAGTSSNVEFLALTQRAKA